MIAENRFNGLANPEYEAMLRAALDELREQHDLTVNKLRREIAEAKLQATTSQGPRQFLIVNKDGSPTTVDVPPPTFNIEPSDVPVQVLPAPVENRVDTAPMAEATDRFGRVVANALQEQNRILKAHVENVDALRESVENAAEMHRQLIGVLDDLFRQQAVHNELVLNAVRDGRPVVNVRVPETPAPLVTVTAPRLLAVNRTVTREGGELTGGTDTYVYEGDGE